MENDCKTLNYSICWEWNRVDTNDLFRWTT